MSSLVFDAADLAIHKSYSVFNPDQEVSGTLREKNVTDWSFKIFAFGSLVGAIIAIAAYVMQLTPLIIVGGILCFTNAFAAYDMKKFGVLKTLEGYTKVLTQRLEELANSVLSLKSENSDLQKVTMEIKHIPEEWQNAIQEGGQKLANKTRELDNATKKLTIAQSKLETMAYLTEALQAQSQLMSQNLLNYTQQNKILGPEVDKIAQHLSDFQTQNSNLADHITKLDEESEQLEKAEAFYEKQNEFLENLVNLMVKIDTDAKEEVNSLQIEASEIKASMVQSNQVSKDLQLLVPQLQEKINTMKSFKEDPEYKRFKEWQKTQNK